jgi:hypothetical protein
VKKEVLMAIGYKVVFVDKRGRLVSCSFLNNAVVYKIGKTTKPSKGGGPLCVFETLEQARRFKYIDNPTWRIYACEYEPSEEKKIWLSDGYTTNYLDALPEGTKLASSVKLTERMV